MGTEKALAPGADLSNHIKDDWRNAHHIWENVQPNLSKWIFLPARVNLSLTDPQATWAEKDVSASVGARAAWIIINRIIVSARWDSFSFRPFGSTVDADAPKVSDSFDFTNPGSMSMRFNKNDLVWVPLDRTTKKFEYQCDSETNTTYYLVAYGDQGE
jgi:hypothetical protein